MDDQTLKDIADFNTFFENQDKVEDPVYLPVETCSKQPSATHLH